MNKINDRDTRKKPSSLLVDDDEVTAFMLEYILKPELKYMFRREAYNVIHACDGRHMMQLTTIHRFDLECLT